MQQRYYDPAIGGFLSVDPIPTNPNNGANFSSYWYANNNPYRFTDPDGRLGTGGCGGANQPACPPKPPPPPCNEACMKMRATSDGKGNQRSGPQGNGVPAGRALTENEKREVAKEYPSADADKARVAENYVADAGYTPGNVMYLAGSKSCADYTTCDGGRHIGFFIHEFGHVNQYQIGNNPFMGHLRMEDPLTTGNYLPLNVYRNTRSWTGLDTERQADWHMHHYLCGEGLEANCR